MFMGNYVNHKNKWAFIHIPKTSGNVISEVLEKIPYTELIDSTHGGIIKFPKIDNYFIFAFVRNPFLRFVSAYLHYNRDFISSTELEPNVNKALKSYNDYIVLYETYIQHKLPLPFSGFISLVRMERLATFIGDTQSELIYIKNNFGNQVNYIAKYENYENEVEFISKKIKYELANDFFKTSHGIPGLKHNSLELETRYKQFYTEQWMIDWVVEYFKDDFKNFGYNLNDYKINTTKKENIEDNYMLHLNDYNLSNLDN